MLQQPDKRLVLTPIQQELFKVISDKRSDLAVCYQAAVAIINDEVLPDRLALAAHALRELLEKLPSDGNAIDMGAALADEVRALQPSWEKALGEDATHGGEPWTNGIGSGLREFLQRMTGFFETRAAVGGGRRQQLVQYLKQLDVAAVGLPENLQQKNAAQLLQLREYFNSVSHHRFAPDETGFRERVSQLEAFLYARMIPRPTADFTAIDALVQEE